MGKSKKGGSSSHHSGNKRKREPSPPSEDFGDSEYSEEEFSSESEGSPAYASPSVSSDDSDDSQGIAAEVWTYIRAVERSGLEGSDELEYSSNEEDSSDSSEVISDSSEPSSPKRSTARMYVHTSAAIPWESSESSHDTGGEA